MCPWNPDNFGVKANAAGQAWYDALMKQYAGWGVDYIKVDCIASHPYKGAEIEMIHKAIVKSGRAMVLSLSPGPTALENAVEVGKNAQLWRISDDVWDYGGRSRREGLAAECEGAVSGDCELGEVCAGGELAGCGYAADWACWGRRRGREAEGFAADGGGAEDDDDAVGDGAVASVYWGESDADG